MGAWRCIISGALWVHGGVVHCGCIVGALWEGLKIMCFIIWQQSVRLSSRQGWPAFLRQIL